ncbi:MAG: hypothetical protein H6551_07045 [Chitinophagales bacterium]|nr:hypothetical protein [Chitinophagaceae bacterium]MCB9064888.1 hypothetical protein [Chitinophagales bacterium]
MLRKLIIITLLLSCTAATYAQKKGKKKKKQKEQTEAAVPEKIDYKSIGALMPPLKVILKDSSVISGKDLENASNIFVMMFNPTCEHCQEETIVLEKNIHLFDKTKVILIASPEMHSYLDFYNNVTRYTKYPSLLVGVDSARFIQNTFLYEALPQINIYNKKRKLVKIFNGDTPIDSLKPYID